MALINTTTTGVLGTTFFGDGAGALTIQENGVTINKITTAPAFSAYASTTQSIANSTATKVVFDIEIFDTNSNFASNRFTPTVAGYYQISSGLFCAGSASGGNILSLYKNGSDYAFFARTLLSGAFNVMSSGSVLVHCNGTSDYLEVYATQNSGGSLTMGNGASTGVWFTGVLVRAA